MRSKAILRDTSKETVETVLFCAPKEYQKSARYFRSAGGTAKGLLAPWNPKEVDKPLKIGRFPPAA